MLVVVVVDDVVEDVEVEVDVVSGKGVVVEVVEVVNTQEKGGGRKKSVVVLVDVVVVRLGRGVLEIVVVEVDVVAQGRRVVGGRYVVGGSSAGSLAVFVEVDDVNSPSANVRVVVVVVVGGVGVMTSNTFSKPLARESSVPVERTLFPSCKVVGTPRRGSAA